MSDFLGKKLIAWDEEKGQFEWVSPRISTKTVYDENGQSLDEILEVSPAELVDIVQNIIANAPEEYDTLQEIAKALNENKDSIGTILREISKKIDLPENGSPGQVLKLNSDGQIVFGSDENTTYVHPANHSADIITETQSRRFITDQERQNWNGKLNPTDVLYNAKVEVAGQQIGLIEYLKNVNDFKISKGQAGGIAELDNTGKVPSSQLPPEQSYDLSPYATYEYVNDKNTVKVLDTRNEAYLPNWYMQNQDRNMVFEFKARETIGSPPINSSSNETYTLMLTMVPWHDNTGGYPTQITFGNSIALRRGISTTEWGSWEELPFKSDIPTALSELNQDGSNRLVTDAEKTSWNNKQNALGYTAENVSKKGSANGYAGLDSTGKVPASQLPSFVDDVIEISSLSGQGETGKIYVLTSNNKTYRWSGSQYVEISESLALGETSSTAYAGDKGKALEQQIAQKANIISMTLEQYNNLATKEPNTLYLISG